MRRTLRIVFWSIVVLAALGGALFGYFVYTPAAKLPKLSGTLAAGTISVGGLKRTYLVYMPKGLRKGAPLVVAMHGSGEDGARMRSETGYAFDRLADTRGFAVVYPDGYEGYWNGCNIVGDYSANRLDIDDVGFLSALAVKLVTEIGIDPQRVFATGVSRGGHMAFRLALEAPDRFRAVAAVSANVPSPDNFKCRPTGHGTSSVMIINGTADPLNPFDGGETGLFGLVRRGKVRASRESARYFAGLNHIADAPQASEIRTPDGTRVEQMLWHGVGAEAELVAVQGGGHGMPQPYRRHPRLLGPSPGQPNGAELIWDFFARQPQRRAQR
jgi:polyhydroxybutyrate depolymerase